MFKSTCNRTTNTTIKAGLVIISLAFSSCSSDNSGWTSQQSEGFLKACYSQLGEKVDCDCQLTQLKSSMTYQELVNDEKQLQVILSKSCSQQPKTN